MPRESTRTVPPSFEFEAVFTSALEVLVWAAAGWVSLLELALLLLELLPHADSRTDAASVGIKNFIAWRIVGSYLADRPRFPRPLTLKTAERRIPSPRPRSACTVPDVCGCRPIGQ
jgi:hypothetical protein